MKDLFRIMHPSKKAFTHWTHRFTKSEEKITATRIDYIITNSKMSKKCSNIQIINKDFLGSDHRPIVAQFSTFQSPPSNFSTSFSTPLPNIKK
jgi:exonuclease III